MFATLLTEFISDGWCVSPVGPVRAAAMDAPVEPVADYCESVAVDCSSCIIVLRDTRVVDIEQHFSPARGTSAIMPCNRLQ
jgi:hypothetical protein